MPKTFKWKVLTGSHVVGETAYGAHLPTGTVFECEQDLSRHNIPGQPARFLLLSTSEDVEAPAVAPNTPAPTEPPSDGNKDQSKDDGLDGMSVAELKTFAGDAKIDVAGLTRKDDLIKAIRAAIAKS